MCIRDRPCPRRRAHRPRRGGRAGLPAAHPSRRLGARSSARGAPAMACERAVASLKFMVTTTSPRPALASWAPRGSACGGQGTTRALKRLARVRPTSISERAKQLTEGPASRSSFRLIDRITIQHPSGSNRAIVDSTLDPPVYAAHNEYFRSSSLSKIWLESRLLCLSRSIAAREYTCDAP